MRRRNEFLILFLFWGSCLAACRTEDGKTAKTTLDTLSDSSIIPTAQAQLEEISESEMALRLVLQAQKEDNLQIRTLLALESMQRDANVDAYGILWQSYSLMPPSTFTIVAPEYEGYPKGVNNLAMSPDGKYLVSSTTKSIGTRASAGDVQIWDFESGEMAAEYEFSGDVWALEFSQDGRFLAVGSAYDDSVVVFDVSSWTEISRMHFENIVDQIDFSPDGNLIIAVDDCHPTWGCFSDQSVVLWEIETGNELVRISNPHSLYYDLQFSPDGNSVYLAHLRDGAHVLDVQRGEVTKLFEGYYGVYAIFDEQAEFFAAISMEDEYVHVFNLSTRKEITRLDSTSPPILFSPDQRILVTADYERLQLWDLESGRLLLELGDYFDIDLLDFSLDAQYFLAGNQVWQIETGELVTHMPYHDPSAALFVADLVVSGSRVGEIRGWQAVVTPETITVQHDASILDAVFSPDAGYLITTGADNTVRIWESGSGSEVARYSQDASVYGLRISRDGRFLIEDLGKEIQVWDVAGGVEHYTIAAEEWIANVVLSPDDRLLVYSVGNTIYLRELLTGNELNQIQLDDFYSFDNLAFDPEGRYLLISPSTTVDTIIWDVEDGTQAGTIPISSSGGVVFDAEGRLSFSGSTLFDPDAGEVLADNPYVHMWDIRLTPDDQYIIGVDDEGVKIVEFETTENIGEIPVHYPDEYGDLDAVSIALSPDGRYVAVMQDHPTASVLLWRPDDIMSALCDRITRNLYPDEWVKFLGDRPNRQTCPNLPEAERPPEYYEHVSMPSTPAVLPSFEFGAPVATLTPSDFAIGSTPIPAVVVPDACTTPSTSDLSALRIVFSAQRDGDIELYSVRGDGEDLVQLTYNQVDDLCPSWSPDGATLAYMSFAGDDPLDDIYMLNTVSANGAGASSLLSGSDLRAQLGQAAWSPDGSMIAFADIEDEIYTFDRRDASFSQISENESFFVDVYDIGWSPDGEELAFAGLVEDQIYIFLAVIKADGSSGQIVETDDYISYYYRFEAWDSSGDRILARVGGDPYWIDVATHEATSLPIQSGLSISSMDLSADEKMLTFDAALTAESDGEYVTLYDRIYVMNLTDGGKAVVLEIEEPISSVRWAPDMQHIAYVWEAEDETHNLSLVNICSGGVTLLVEDIDQTQGCEPAWQP